MAQTNLTTPPHVEPWPSDWLRGALEVCVLGILGRGQTYGYALGQALEEAGLGTVKGGTLYPLLSRLETAGFVEVQWRAGEGGPGRKYYELSAAGRAELARQTQAWARFTELTSKITGADVPTGRGTP